MNKNNTPEDELRTDPPSANEDVAKLRLQLSHYSLSELEQEGLVRYDRDEQIVKKGPRFDEKKSEGDID
ncbi:MULTISPECIES: hypothetical protein [Natronococcus]|uniref:hypothetical protein n=1 Tax=Natronococcus TaxID=29287 RepID=UPI0012692980|nr:MULTISPECIES: hypothetical protein [Natronococcus]NKE37759.1 hypothetical protein [Natronococcus sp. JC468]